MDGWTDGQAGGYGLGVDMELSWNFVWYLEVLAAGCGVRLGTRMRMRGGGKMGILPTTCLR